MAITKPKPQAQASSSSATMAEARRANPSSAFHSLDKLGYYKRLPKPYVPQTAKRSRSGMNTHTARSSKLSTLEEWEGFRTARDPRSPTGYTGLGSDSGLPIHGIDANGHVIRKNLKTGKISHAHPTPAGSDGGFLGKVTKVLKVVSILGGDMLGLGIETFGSDKLKGFNTIRVQTGAVVATGLGAGALVSGGALTGGVFPAVGSGVKAVGAVAGVVSQGSKLISGLSGGTSVPAYTGGPQSVPSSSVLPLVIVAGGALVLLAILSRR